MVANLKLLKTGSPIFNDPKLYRMVVGSLQYACTTRLELAFSINIVS